MRQVRHRDFKHLAQEHTVSGKAGAWTQLAQLLYLENEVLTAGMLARSRHLPGVPLLWTDLIDSHTFWSLPGHNDVYLVLQLENSKIMETFKEQSFNSPSISVFYLLLILCYLLLSLSLTTFCYPTQIPCIASGTVCVTSKQGKATCSVWKYLQKCCASLWWDRVGKGKERELNTAAKLIFPSAAFVFKHWFWGWIPPLII